MKALFCFLMLIISQASFAENKSKMYLAPNGYIYEDEDKNAKTCTYKSARIITKGKNEIAKSYDLSFAYKKNKGFFKSNDLIIHINASIAARLDPNLNQYSISELQIDVPKKASHRALVSFDKETKNGATSAITDKKLLKALNDAIALNVEITYTGGELGKEKTQETASLSADDIAAVKAIIKLCEKKDT